MVLNIINFSSYLASSRVKATWAWNHSERSRHSDNYVRQLFSMVTVSIPSLNTMQELSLSSLYLKKWLKEFIHHFENQ